MPGLVGGAAVLAVLLLTPIARAVTLTPPEETLVKPGTYATLVFAVDGDGQFAFDVEVPPAVQVLTRKGNVRVSGHAVVFVTAVVREGVEAGTSFIVSLRLLDGGVEAASARARLRVALDAGVSLQPVPELTARIGSPLYLHTTITNRGNARDRIELRAVYSKWRVHITPSVVELDPGERASIDVTVTQTTLTSNGYRSVFYLEAASSNDPEVTTRVVVASRWYSSAVEGKPATAPQLVVSLETGVQASAKVYQGDFEGSLAYSVAPAIEGDLSDFVSGEAHTNRIAGDVRHPFANTPSGLSLALNAPTWNAAMDAYPGHYSVATHFDVGAWGLEVDGRLVPSPADTVYGVTVRGISQLPWLDLQLSAGSSQMGGTRTDSVRADYSVPLLPNLDLGLGAQVAGYDQPGQPYSVVAAVSQSFGWRNRDFEVSESYSGVPQSGTHSIGSPPRRRRHLPVDVLDGVAACGLRLLAERRLRRQPRPWLHARGRAARRWSDLGPLLAGDQPWVVRGAGPARGHIPGVDGVRRQAAGLRLQGGVHGNVQLRPGHGPGAWLRVHPVAHRHTQRRGRHQRELGAELRELRHPGDAPLQPRDLAHLRVRLRQALGDCAGVRRAAGR
ncbi:MAG: hypothetical protein P8Z81_08520 [Deinococcales bacterium]